MSIPSTPSRKFNDIIVGETVERSRRRRFGQVVASELMFTTTSILQDSNSSQSMTVDAKSKTASGYILPSISQTKSLVNQLANENVLENGNYVNMGTILRRQLPPLGQGVTVPERQQRTKTPGAQSKSDTQNDSYARHRERQRSNQTRYRKKVALTKESLENEVQQLHQQIHHLQLKRLILMSRPPTRVTPWIIVSEYFRLFRYGYKGIKKMSSPSQQICEQGEIQMNFLKGVMTSDVSVNCGFGVDALVQEWLAVPLVHQDITVRLVRLEHDDGNAIHATVKPSTTITNEMLLSEFPYFVNHSQDHRSSLLMTKLVGMQVIIPTTVRFEWDSITNRISSMRYTCDLVTPFLNLLGNVQDTAQVLENSLLSIAIAN